VPRTREGRLAEFAGFGWGPEAIPDPHDPATFARSKLDWRERAREPHADLFAWYRGLIRLRRMIPALADGRMDRVRVHGDEHARWLTVERGAIIVACNLATRAQRVPIGREQASEVLLTSDPMIELNASGAALPPDSVVVLGPGEP
jgi:maltooligosyltrehalose trehalohydrolase